jgi:hypothetical protein
MFFSRRLSSKVCHLLQKFFVIIFGLLKMSQGQSLQDTDPELINEKNLYFEKPKLFFKNIGRYAATSTYIHVRGSTLFKFWTPKTQSSKITNSP